MVTDYDAAMILFTKYGTHLPDFYGYCKNKAATYYYRLYIMSKPDSHKLFGAVLSQEIFSASGKVPFVRLGFIVARGAVVELHGALPVTRGRQC
jgi:hypothetical protein